MSDKPRPGQYLPALLAVTVIVFMVVRPVEVFDAARTGLSLWWEIIVPALLPFFVGSEILVGLGVVHGMGVLLEPLMRPLFNVPGTGSFVLAMGLASGYPIGSVLTSRLRRQELCSRTEAERLMSFANTADPLFMSGAVAVGMFGLPGVAGPIMTAHYTSTLILGLLLRWYRRTPFDGVESVPMPSLSRALVALVEARRTDGRPLGGLLGDAVRNSMSTLLLIGGFVIVFSVIVRLLQMTGLSTALSALLSPTGIPSSLTESLTAGLFEITLGIRQAAESTASLSARVTAAGAIIAWSGLSVHCQVAAIIQGTDISVAPYIIARSVHAVLAAGITMLLLSLGWTLPVAVIRPVPAGWMATLSLGSRMFLLSTGLWVAIALATTWLVRRRLSG